MDQWLKFLQDAGFDGWEEASWELDLDRCDTDAGAEAYAKERVDLAKKHGLEIFTVATHLQGQALGDEPSAKTLQFVGGEAVAAYKAWRDKGNKPPRTDPYFVPDEVGKLIHEQASQATCSACVRLAHYLGKLQNRKVALPGFVGSPAHCWSHCFLFPPLPSEHRRPCDPRRPPGQPGTAGRALRPGLGRLQEVRRHLRPGMPSRASGRWATSNRRAITSTSWTRPATSGVVGFNLDGSHMEWQGVSVVQFIREFGDCIHCAHVKGVQVIREHTRAGRLGGHRPMGHPHNGWNFVTAGTPATPTASRRSSSS